MSAILMTPTNSSDDSGTGRLFTVDIVICACCDVNRVIYPYQLDPFYIVWEADHSDDLISAYCLMMVRVLSSLSYLYPGLDLLLLDQSR